MQNLYSIFFFGFSSGIPFLLILSTLSIWLSEAGISKTTIGLLAWVSVPYTIKFFWGALIDKYKIPYLTNLFGLRRSWILCAQICVWIFLSALGSTDPNTNIWATALFAFLVSCGSAVQDIATEAYRIEILPHSKVGIGASISVLGYRLGMLCSSAGTIFLATYFNSWSIAYNFIAACMFIGIVTTVFSIEPHVQGQIWRQTFSTAVKSLMHKLDWQLVLLFILSYKIADTVINVMSMPFLIEIGFNNLEIAFVAKTFGIGAMILGGIFGGILCTQYSLRKNLLICVVLQAIASILFVIQAQLGHNLSFLFVSMGVENLACGMSQVALVAYLSHLCNQRSTAMHYAILTSFASLARVVISSSAGWLADRLAWPQFYVLVCISCLPSLFLLILAAKHLIYTSSISQSTNGEIFDVN